MNKCLACNNEEELPEGRIVCYNCEKELNELAKKGSLLKPKEIHTNTLYEYLETKLIKGQCMDNDIATELRCMTDEEIMTILHRIKIVGTLDYAKEILDNGYDANNKLPDNVWQKQDNKTINGIKQ